MRLLSGWFVVREKAQYFGFAIHTYLRPRENESSCLPFYEKHPNSPHTSSSKARLWFPLVPSGVHCHEGFPDLVELVSGKSFYPLSISWEALVFQELWLTEIFESLFRIQPSQVS